jgi:hypothetical protein
MKCKEFKYFLLGCENPDQPPADVKAHLANCADCQDWQNRMALIEMNVPFLPVPESAARAELLRKIRVQPATARTKEIGIEKEVKMEDRGSEIEEPIVRRPSSLRGRERPSSSRRGVLRYFRELEPSARRFAMGGVAAAVLLIAFGWMVLHTHTPYRPMSEIDQNTRQTSDSLLANMIRRDIQLADADKPADRFLALADLADDFSNEVKTLARLPDAKDVLDKLSKKYEIIVNEGLLETAKQLPTDEAFKAKRDELLNQVAERLQIASRTVKEQGDLLSGKIPKTSRDAIKDVSTVADRGDQALRDMRSEASLPPPVKGLPSDSTALVQKETP